MNPGDDTEPPQIKTEDLVLERAYRLVENQDVSRKWLHFQTFAYVFAAVSGFVCAYCLRTFRNLFSDSCLLNIELNLHTKDSGSGLQAVFGSSTSCDFCEFVPLVSSIFALVLAMFFVMSGRGGKGSPGFLPSPWRIVIPALFVNIIALSITTVSTCMLQNGLQRFCDQLLGKEVEMSGMAENSTTTDISVNPERGFRTLTGCRVDLNISSPIPPESHNPLHAITPSNYALLEISQIASWCIVVSWAACVLISFLRFMCVADFRLVRYDFILVENGYNKPTGSSSSLRTAEEESKDNVITADVSRSQGQLDLL